MRYRTNSTSHCDVKIGTCPIQTTRPSTSWCTLGHDDHSSRENATYKCSCLDLFTSLASTHTVTVSTTWNTSLGFPSVGTFRTTYETAIITDPSYKPPRDCCMYCRIIAADVRLLYWPVEFNTYNESNATITAAPTPYTYTSDGFSL